MKNPAFSSCRATVPGAWTRWTIWTLWILAACTVGAAGAWGAGRSGSSFPARELRPFWLSRTMWAEPVLFVRDRPDGPARASLLFEPVRVLEVRSASGLATYREGRDYLWKPGTRELVLPPGSGVVCATPGDLRRPARSQPYRLTHRDGQGEILFGAGHEYHDLQTVVTYTHRGGAWKGPAPSLAGDLLPRATARLKARQPLAVALLGDSISTGCNASGWARTAPFQPPYQDLLVSNLQALCRAPVTLTNFAVSGTDTQWGLGMIDRVAAAQPDLAILAFGMNDASGRPAAEYQANTRAMIEALNRSAPGAEVILVAPMLGNRDWTVLHPELFPQYRDALAQLCRPGVALADLTSFWTLFLQRKQDWDLTGNGVNHPNDFGHRVYAQVLSALLVRKFPSD